VRLWTNSRYVILVINDNFSHCFKSAALLLGAISCYVHRLVGNNRSSVISGTLKFNYPILYKHLLKYLVRFFFETDFFKTPFDIN